jgi:hypothetical protein
MLKYGKHPKTSELKAIVESWLDVLVASMDTWLQLQDQDMTSATGTAGILSGHYGVYGLNVQAVCDYRSRLTYFALVAPGKCSDQVAFERSLLPELMQAFPVGTYLVGNAAYSVSEKMIFPFTGTQQANPCNNTHNFYLSQLRIRIEMAFGLMIDKWRILRAPLQTGLAKLSEVLEC